MNIYVFKSFLVISLNFWSIYNGKQKVIINKAEILLLILKIR